MGGGGCATTSSEPFQTLLPTVASQDDFASDPEVWDVIIVGAGVAGAALAKQQADDGRRVLVVERDLSQPDRIVGELLQPGGYVKLKSMGLASATDGIDSVKVYGYCLMKDGQEAVVKYPMEGYEADVAGRSFHHGRFVQNLRIHASEVEGVTMRQGFVKKLLNRAGNPWDESSGEAVAGVSYKGTDGEEHTSKAHLTVVCDGMYSTLRKKLADPPVIKHPSYFVGLMLKGATLPHANHGHVVLAKPSPILFYPISSTDVRCLVDVPGEKLPSQHNGELARYLKTIVAPEIPEILRAPFLEAVEAGGIRVMQNKQLSASPLHPVGALLLGDAFNMRHPLTGGGMTVALSDTKLLCDMLRPLPGLDDAVATANGTSDFYTARKPVSATINTLANALYKVFCSTGDPAQEEMRDACFAYLKQGGMYAEGPVSLLSGLNPRPSVLVMHFFMVALYGVGRLLLPRPSLKGLWMSFALLAVAVQIITPIILAEGPVSIFLPWLVPKHRAEQTAQGTIKRTKSFVAK